MRHILSTALVALVVGSLAGVTVSTLAQEPAPTTPPDEAIVTAGLNADTVDGRHAVKAISKKTQRKNKLVATDSKGYLPNNIVKPKWGLISEKPPGFADGVDDVGYATGTFACEGPIPATGVYFRFTGIPREVMIDFQVVPTGPAVDWLYIDSPEVQPAADGTLTMDVWIDDILNTGAQTCNIRAIAWYEGISLARANRQMDKITSTRVKRQHR